MGDKEKKRKRTRGARLMCSITGKGAARGCEKKDRREVHEGRREHEFHPISLKKKKGKGGGRDGDGKEGTQLSRGGKPSAGGKKKMMLCGTWQERGKGGKKKEKGRRSW